MNGSLDTHVGAMIIKLIGFVPQVVVLQSFCNVDSVIYHQQTSQDGARGTGVHNSQGPSRTKESSLGKNELDT